MLDDFRPKPHKAKIQPITPAPPAAEKLIQAANRYDDVEIIDEAEAFQPAQPIAVHTAPTERRHWWHHLNPKTWTKKQAIIISAAAVVVLLGGGGAAYALFHHSPAKPVVAKTVVKPQPIVVATPILSPLTGRAVTAAQAKLPVTGLMIENSPEARPQSGLDQAGVVFEAIAEGGITRFLALYQESMPDYVGPVRSVRPYYLDWLLGFDASIAHVGGSPEALNDIKTLGAKDLDQFANGSSYTRISSRAAPHNVYTSLTRMQALEQTKGYATSSFTAWPRKASAPAATPTASSIDLNISDSYYNVHYDYNAASNNYNRSEGGAPHMELDASGNRTQIHPDVVVAMVINHTLQSDGDHNTYATIGSGAAYVFQDGTVTIGTWAKTASRSQLTFTDQAGKAIAFNPGQTWLTMVSATSDITYK